MTVSTSPIVLDGKATAKAFLARLKQQIDAQAFSHPPCLTVVLVGENPASQVYVKKKVETAQSLGLASELIVLPDDTAEDTLLDLIASLNANTSVHGILVQLPLPAGMNSQRVLEAIAPEKDVDGFHPVNVGKLAGGLSPFAVPCTPKGVMHLLEAYELPVAGKHAVIVGRSNIVGKPMAQLLLAQNATVTICHSKTPNLPEMARQADILVAAVGIPKLITPEWVRPGAAVIDVGINRDPETQKLVGDVDYAAVLPVCYAITPVPGGVGPMTVAMLMANTIDCYRAQQL